MSAEPLPAGSPFSGTAPANRLLWEVPGGLLVERANHALGGNALLTLSSKEMNVPSSRSKRFGCSIREVNVALAQLRAGDPVGRIVL
jgi:hypothetical protein